MTNYERTRGFTSEIEQPETQGHEQHLGALALRRLVFDGHEERQLQVRDAVVELGDVPVTADGDTYYQQAHAGYELLPKAVEKLGGSARAIAKNIRERDALFDWSAVAATRLLPVLSGHFNLTLEAMRKLGDGSDKQRDYLEQLLGQLDDGNTTGVMILTELGHGSDVLDLETEAVVQNDETGRHILLNTPTAEAIKFMPNVGDETAPKNVVVAARLKVDGKDEGVYLFALPLRDENGELTEGIEVVSLPEKGAAPMDNSMIRFKDKRLPMEAWLSAGKSEIDEEGRFTSKTDDLRQRFHEAIGQLQTGRLSLASAAVASARAGLAQIYDYAVQRYGAGNMTMIERDNFQREFVPALTEIYAMTTLGNETRNIFTDPTSSQVQIGAMAMLAKPIMSYTARNVLDTMRQRAGAQGMFRVNNLIDYKNNIEGIITAEGENQVLEVAMGRAFRKFNSGYLQVKDIEQAPKQWWNELLVEREQFLSAKSLAKDTTDTFAIGDSTLAEDHAEAVAERLAAESLAVAAAKTEGLDAKEIAEDLAALYALNRIRNDHNYFLAHGTNEQKAEVMKEYEARIKALLPHVSALVDAFAIPDLHAPMSGDYVNNWADYAGWNDLPRTATT